MCCQVATAVLNGQNVADVSGLAVIQCQLVIRYAMSDVAVQTILPSGTKATVLLLTSAGYNIIHVFCVLYLK